MTNSTNNHLQDLIAKGGPQGQTQKHMVMEASIQGVNDAYLIILMIGVMSLLLSFFIKRVENASEEKSHITIKKPARI